MEDGIRAASVVDGGAYVPLPEEAVEVDAPYDDARLNQLGYKQELRRSLSYVLYASSFLNSAYLLFLINQFTIGLFSILGFIALHRPFKIAPFDF